MSTPPSDPVLSSPISVSPPSGPVPRRTGSGSPVRYRNESPTLRRRPSASSDAVHDVAHSRPPRLSPTLIRGANLDDPDARERQRTLDVDMAMHMARARSHTVSTPPTAHIAPSYHHPHSPAGGEGAEGEGREGRTTEDMNFSLFTAQEEMDLESARVGGAPGNALGPPGLDEAEMAHAPIASADVNLNLDDTVLHAAPHDVDVDPGEPFLPMYQPFAARASNFDFSIMQDFAAEETARLGLDSPPISGVRWRDFTAPRRAPGSAQADGTPIAGEDEAGPSTPGPRLRQRRMSQSKSVPRSRHNAGRKKMALFEGTAGAPPPSFSFGDVPAAADSFEQLPTFGSAGAGGVGHDRPYRFSFYSNALSATIHARSLAELPAKGQTFQELFLGTSQSRSGNEARPDGTGNGGSGTNSVPASTPASVKATGSPSRVPSAQGIAPGYAGPGRLYSDDPLPGYGNANGANGNAGVQSGASTRPASKAAVERGIPAPDPEANTWWLDVTSPTDEEMKMLTKVFSIHPLTTEDIQMEETREKIELFRNYYFVCFRSFDQDPYSPTHLEPLNMYIIVFREGTLSFHFRPTSHPQNVRRRIKQLKDYISVTSDWISYALIDDITDAFGPLIQSIEYEVDSIDELVLILKEAEQSDMLRRIGTCRKKVMGLLRLMGNKADVVKGLAKRCNENWRVAPTSDIGLYLSDIQDHLITMTQNLNHYEKILSRSHSNYLAQISIEMTDANNQINDVLSKMTALGTVLIPMNLVTGLWGMNVHVPGEGSAGLAWFFSILGSLIVFAALGGYITFRLMKR